MGRGTDRHPRYRAVALVVCLLATLATRTADAQPSGALPTPEQARALYLDALFREALAAYEGVLMRPDLDVRTAADAHLHLAALRFTFGEPERARAHAEAAVALVPDAGAPEGAPGEVLAMVREAREREGGAPARLQLELGTESSDGASRAVRARLAPAPGALALTVGVRCRWRGSAPAESRGPPPEVEVTVPTDDVVRCESAAFTRGGAVLFEAERELAPIAVVASDEDDGGSAATWIWVGVGAAVVAGAAVAIALVATSSSDAPSQGNPIVRDTVVVAEGW